VCDALYTTIFVALMNYNELLDLSKKTSLLLYVEGGFFLLGLSE